MGELENLRSTLNNKGLSSSTKKAIERRISQLEKPAPSSAPRTYDNVVQLKRGESFDSSTNTITPPKPQPGIKTIPVKQPTPRAGSPVRQSTKPINTTTKTTPFVGPPAPTDPARKNPIPSGYAPLSNTEDFFINSNNPTMTKILYEGRTGDTYERAIEQKYKMPVGYLTSKNDYDRAAALIAFNIHTYTKTRKQITSDPIDTQYKTAEGKIIDQPAALGLIGGSISGLENKRDIIAYYEKEGYNIRNTKEGGYDFYKDPEQVKQEMINTKKDELKDFYKSNPLGGAAHSVTQSFLSWEDPGGMLSAYYAFTGQKDKYFDTKARAAIDLETSLEAGIPFYALKVATGPVMTVAASYGIGAGIKAAGAYAIGRLTPIIGAKAITGAVTATQLSLLGVTGYKMGEDVITTYKERGPELAIAKGLTYGAAIYTGVKGAKSVDAAKWSTKGSNRYYAKHPDVTPPKTVTMKEGQLVSMETETKGYQTKNTNIEIDQVRVTQKGTYKPGKKWLMLTTDEAAARSGPSFEMQGSKFSTPRNIAYEQNPLGEVSGSKNYFKTVRLLFSKALSGEKVTKGGQRIYSKNVYDIKITNEMAASEIAGKSPEGSFFKSITKTPTKTNIITDTTATQKLMPLIDTLKVSPELGLSNQLAPVFLPSSINAPAFTGGISVFNPEITGLTGEKVSPPVFKGIDTIENTQSGPGTITDIISDFDKESTTKSSYDNIIKQDITQDITQEIYSDTSQGQDQYSFKGIDTIQDSFFSSPPPTKTGPPFKSPRFALPGFLPRGLSGSGGTDSGFGFLDPFSRSRKHKVKNIVDEMERLKI